MPARALLRRSLHDRVLVTLIAGLALMTGWYATGLGPAAAQAAGAWVFIAAVHLTLVAVAFSLSRVPGLPSGARRFWRGVAPAGLIYLAGDIGQLVMAPGGPVGGPVELATLSLGSAWLGVVLLTAPLGLASRRERQRFWLDVATVMAGAAVVGWYLVVPARTASPMEEAGPVLMGPVVLMLCVFVVAKLIISGTAPFTRWTAAVGVLAAAVKSGADALGSDGRAVPLFLALIITSHALLVGAIRIGYVQVTGDPEVLRPRRRRPYSLMPYGAIAVTYVLLTVAVIRQDRATVAVALGGAAVSTALVVVRQLAAFRDNDRLVDELRSSLAERDDLAARLRHQAFHDGLTGLPNRALFTERLESALAAGGTVTVMLVDLDDFKLVNDAWGHAAGDLLLREIAGRLRTCVRPADLVARLGGDEFAILVSPARHPTRAVRPGSRPTGISAAWQFDAGRSESPRCTSGQLNPSDGASATGSLSPAGPVSAAGQPSAADQPGATGQPSAADQPSGTGPGGPTIPADQHNGTDPVSATGPLNAAHEANAASAVNASEPLSATGRGGSVGAARPAGADIWSIVADEYQVDPREIAACVVEAARAPVAIDGSWARVGASVGIAISGPAGEAGAAALLREADHAMYDVKRTGKGAYAISGEFAASEPAS